MVILALPNEYEIRDARPLPPLSYELSFHRDHVLDHRTTTIANSLQPRRYTILDGHREGLSEKLG